MTELYDYSFSKIPAKKVKEAGIAGVIRYLGKDSKKRITKEEIEDIKANGLTLNLVYQDWGQAPYINKEYGESDGRRALEQLKELGLPEDSVVFFAIDFDTSSGGYNTRIREYIKAAQQFVKNAGIYGGFHTCELFRYTNVPRWQTYAWSGSKVSDGILIYQYKNGQSFAGGQVDFNRTDLKNYGQIDLNGSQKPSVPKKIEVDEIFGDLSTRELQKQLGINQTGFIDYDTIGALQKKFGTKIDNKISFQSEKSIIRYWPTIAKKRVSYEEPEKKSDMVVKLQLFVGAEPDGKLGRITAGKTQEALNADKFV
jgi:hypothetical protein